MSEGSPGSKQVLKIIWLEKICYEMNLNKEVVLSKVPKYQLS